jgi:hypothetical protein
MATENSNPKEQQPNSILSYFWDLPNICSLAGLGCTILAIYFIILGVYSAAMIGMIWAVAFDWADGLVARRMKGRTGSDQLFGGQLSGLETVSETTREIPNNRRYLPMMVKSSNSLASRMRTEHIIEFVKR